MTPDLYTDIGGLVLKNPIMTASGTFGYGIEFSSLLDLNSIGGIIVKGLSLEPAKGNPPPRIAETACGMLNAIGLENIGIQAFIKDKLPFLKQISSPTIVNIYGKTIEEYVELAKIIDTVPGILGIEVNISCPNVKAGGVSFGTDPGIAYQVVSKIRKVTQKHMMVKLTPNVTEITTIATAVEEAGANSISLINTLTGMAIDIKTRRSKLANIIGGLSGPAIKPIALRMVWQTVNAVKIPVIGIGGIFTAEDVIEFLIVGATAVQVGTANFINALAIENIINDLDVYLIENKVKNVRDIIGSISI